MRYLFLIQRFGQFRYVRFGSQERLPDVDLAVSKVGSNRKIVLKRQFDLPMRLALAPLLTSIRRSTDGGIVVKRYRLPMIAEG